MNKNKWSSLPNAHHIDWVIESLRENPQLWIEAGMTWNTAWYTVGNAAYDAKRNAAKNAARDAARRAAWEDAGVAVAVSTAAREAAWRAAWRAVVALIAYDDCDQFLSMKYEKLQIWAALSEHPAAVLLQPMVYVREKYETK